MPGRTVGKGAPKSAEFVTASDDESDRGDVNDRPASRLEESTTLKRKATTPAAKPNKRVKLSSSTVDVAPIIARSPEVQTSQRKLQNEHERTQQNNIEKERSKQDAGRRGENSAHSDTPVRNGSARNIESLHATPISGSVHRLNKSAPGGNEVHRTSKAADTGQPSSSVRPSNNAQISCTPTSTAVNSQPPYQPPHGFEPVNVTSYHNDVLENLFSPANMEGKQIWNITAPASVPLSEITELAQNQLTQGAVVMSHGGMDYGFAPSHSNVTSKMKLLVPSRGGSFYNIVHTAVTESFNLHPIVQIPPLAIDNIRNASGGTSRAIKEVQQQPKGLRTRWWPAGFEHDHKDGDMDIESTSSSEPADERDMGNANPGSSSIAASSMNSSSSQRRIGRINRRTSAGVREEAALRRQIKESNTRTGQNAAILSSISISSSSDESS